MRLLLKNRIINSGDLLVSTATLKLIYVRSLGEELSKRSDLPWICIEDFNEIMHGREKEGGNICPKWQMKNFCEAVNQCNLRDIGYTRSNFTWCRRLGNCGWVRERLDRALVSTKWSITFPNVRLHHVAASMLDHCMLVLKAPRDRQWRT